jgi:hypothetical protein
VILALARCEEAVMITVTNGAAQRAFLPVSFRNGRRFSVYAEIVCGVIHADLFSPSMTALKES